MPDIKVVEITGLKKQWADFVEEAINGTFYHDPEFVGIYAHKAKEAVCVAFKKGNKFLALLPGGIVENNGVLEFNSPFSASFTGICYSKELKLNETLEVIRLLERYCASRGISRIALQHPPSIYYDTPDERIDYALGYSGYRIEKTELTFYLDSVDRVSPSACRNIRKAERSGLTFKEACDLKEIWEFLHMEKDKKGFYLSVSLKELLALKEAFREKVRAFGVYKGSKLLSAMVIYYLNKRAALGFTWAQQEEHQMLRPTDYLIFNAGKTVFSGGFRYFDLGTGTINGEPVWGVSRFKENYSARTATRKRYTKVL